MSWVNRIGLGKILVIVFAIIAVLSALSVLPLNDDPVTKWYPGFNWSLEPGWHGNLHSSAYKDGRAWLFGEVLDENYALHEVDAYLDGQTNKSTYSITFWLEQGKEYSLQVKMNGQLVGEGEIVTARFSIIEQFLSSWFTIPFIIGIIGMMIGALFWRSGSGRRSKITKAAEKALKSEDEVDLGDLASKTELDTSTVRSYVKALLGNAPFNKATIQKDTLTTKLKPRIGGAVKSKLKSEEEVWVSDIADELGEEVPEVKDYIEEMLDEGYFGNAQLRENVLITKPPEKVEKPGEKAGRDADDQVLQYVKGHGGAISISKASEELGISKKELKSILKRLEEEGRLEKE